MIFEQLNEGACKTYLLGSGRTRDAMLVDPVLEGVDDYIWVLKDHRLRLRYVLDTHVHADHISGSAALRDRTGCDYVMHQTSASACANMRVSEGDILHVGDLEIRVLHVPGHTQDSLLLALPDRILTGDFLFLGEGGAGRTDLPGGDPFEHWDSLQKLSEFGEATLVYPGHDYHGRTHSTLGDERRYNPRLRFVDREAYGTWLEAQRLGPAAWMAEVVQANYACARDPRAAWIPVDSPSCEVRGTAGNVNAELVHTIAAESLMELVRRGVSPVVLDVRQPEEFSGDLGHIQGARLLPVGELPRRLSELSGLEDKPIVLVCRAGGRSATAAAILNVAGFKGARSLDGGMVRWRQLGYSVAYDDPHAREAQEAAQGASAQP